MREIGGAQIAGDKDSFTMRACFVYVAHRMLIRWRRVAVLLVLAFGALLLQVSSAGAVFRPGPPPGAPPQVRGNTELVMSGTGNGQGVAGFIAETGTNFDPVLTSYPTSPPAGFRPLDEGFAGIIFAHPPEGGNNLSLYCIDILTATYGGIGYTLGTWDTANVPNVGYVTRLLNEYYPNTSEPATLADGNPASVNQTAAAVQAAIWYFTDKYVLSASDPLHGTVAAIVAHIQGAGPVGEQPQAHPHDHALAHQRPRTQGAGTVQGRNQPPACQRHRDGRGYVLGRRCHDAARQWRVGAVWQGDLGEVHGSHHCGA